MKKSVMFIACMFCLLASYAQKDSVNIVATIETFFDGMETFDTAKINTTVDTNIFLYSIMKNGKGNTILENETKEDFYKQMISLKGKKYDEQILSYSIKIDGNMAIVWAPYEFIYEAAFSHCGVNVFAMIKRGEAWKILGITDTRRKQGCR